MALNQQLQSQKVNPIGTGYTNIQRIIQANQANKLGGAVAGGIQQAGQAARGAITQAGQQFQTNVEKEKQRLEQEKERAQRVVGDVTKASSEDISAFEKIRGAQSLGPTGIANADELRQKAQEAEQLGTAGGSQAGRYGLLQRYVGGNKQYTGGQQRVDALLLGQTAAPQLRAARKDTLGLGQQAATQQLAAQEVGKTLQGGARALRDETLGGLGQATTAYDQAMVDKLASETAARQDYVKNLFGNIDSATGNYDQASRGPVKVSQEDMDQLAQASNNYLQSGSVLGYGDLSQLIKANTSQANKQNVQSQEDYDRANMIAKLSGGDLTGDTGALLQAYAENPQLVGQFAASNKFDTGGVGKYGNLMEQIKENVGSEKNSAALAAEYRKHGQYNMPLAAESDEERKRRYGLFRTLQVK